MVSRKAKYKREGENYVRNLSFIEIATRGLKKLGLADTGSDYCLVSEYFGNQLQDRGVRLFQHDETIYTAN